QMLAERDPPVGDGRREQDAPAVFGHPDIAELGPALGLDADRGAQIDEARLEALGPALPPPVETARVPAFERPPQPRVGIEPDIVRDQPVIIDADGFGHVLLLPFASFPRKRDSRGPRLRRLPWTPPRTGIMRGDNTKL